MKKQLPLILSLVIGFLALAVFYIPAKIAGDIEDTLLSWGQVLAAAALVLGGINIIQVNYPKIRRRERDWQYKVLLLATAAIMLAAGIPWHRLASEPEAPSVTVASEIDQNLAAENMAAIVVRSSGDAMVIVEGARSVPATIDGTPSVIEVEAGVPLEVKVSRGTSKFPIAGYSAATATVELAPGQSAQIGAELQMRWGLEGRVFTWLYDHVFDPCNSTMFALLAFFIASAAFRAFRARNVEAALLLGAAILVMLGRVPIGSLVSESFPLISDWLVDVPNNAGRRAIMMGAALGAVATGLRVILGLERSHLGAD